MMVQWVSAWALGRRAGADLPGHLTRRALGSANPTKIWPRLDWVAQRAAGDRVRNQLISGEARNEARFMTDFPRPVRQ